MTETIKTTVNGGLVIEEIKAGIRFGTDAILLAEFIGTVRRAADLGSGSGIVSFLVLQNSPNATVTGIELDGTSALLSIKNAERNGLSSRFDCISDDVRNVRSLLTAGSLDCVFTNPPYLKSNNGFKNSDPHKFAAFHETTADIDDFVSTAAYLLKFGGRFCAVYRPEYMSKLFRAMEKHDIRPKRLRIIFPSAQKPPSLILVEGKKGAKDGMITEAPFFIYSDSSHTSFSPEMRKVYAIFD